MSGTTTAFWGMTINNYDETDLALVQNGYPDHMREIIHTLEKGTEKGTPHIQAWIKLQRQQRLSFVRKLFPRGRFQPLTHDEYVANTKKYAQKLDETAVSAAVHKFNDPLHTIESVCKRVAGYILYADPDNIPDHTRHSQLERRRLQVQHDLVMEDYRYAKIFVSSTYKAMWKDYGYAIIENMLRQENEKRELSRHTHTHTHSDEKFSREGGITSDADASEDSQGEEGSDASDAETEDGKDYQDSSSAEDEGYSEGSGDGTSEEDS